ncbi:M23 family metallopeptidase [Chryseobacterium turcicum]|nr:M23 family metallopeptidase [Chryseobacterium turcicum]
MKKSKIILLGFILMSGFSFAQFNTLIPTLPKKSENLKIAEKSDQEDPAKQKKDKKFWKQILNITTKSALKQEIDSLKMLIKEYGSVKDERINDIEKLKTSLTQLTQNQLEKKRETLKKQNAVRTYDFADEPTEYFSKIVMPLKNKLTVTSSYGTRTHPIFGSKKMHNGIDLKASYENVYSVIDGIVTATGWDPKGGGNFIKVKHFNRFETTYMHLSEIYYKIGDRVKAGFIIGKSGNTGNSTGPHLHFSVKEFGQNINPSQFLNDLIKVNNLIANHYEH